MNRLDSKQAQKSVDLKSSALFYKLYEIGIGGKFIKIIQSIYENNVPQVKVGKTKIHNAFTATVGVRQGDNLSPKLFNIFINDVVDVFDKDSCDPVQLVSTYFNCLLCADHVIWYLSLPKDYKIA